MAKRRVIPIEKHLEIAETIRRAHKDIVEMIERLHSSYIGFARHSKPIKNLQLSGESLLNFCAAMDTRIFQENVKGNPRLADVYYGETDKKSLKDLARDLERDYPETFCEVEKIDTNIKAD